MDLICRCTFLWGWKSLFKCCSAALFRTTDILNVSWSIGPSLGTDVPVAGKIYMYFLSWPLLTQAVILGKKTFLHVDFSFCLSCFFCSSCLLQSAQSNISKETDKLSPAARRRLALCVFCVPDNQQVNFLKGIDKSRNCPFTQMFSFSF